jgi:hypothetical protein
MRDVDSRRSRLLSAAAVIRLALVAALLMTIAVTVSAYTLVFRDGRRIEVRPEFVLTRSTLTYEIAPGFNRTVQLILIDVAATERANREAAGAFLKRAEPKSNVAAPPFVSPARITLTNRDLESIKQRRIESERNYEKRRIELGLPSIEASRRQRAQEEESLLAYARERALEQARDEAYWRARARALRSEIVASDAELRYVRTRLSELGQFPLATHSLVTSVLPLVPLATNSAFGAPAFTNPRTFGPPVSGFGPPVVGFGPRPGRGHVWGNQAQLPNRRPQFARPWGGYPYGFPVGSAGFGFTSGPFDYLEDAGARASLSARLDDLMVQRAGLEARWRELEDEAREARAPQIWLEP